MKEKKNNSKLHCVKTVWSKLFIIQFVKFMKYNNIFVLIAAFFNCMKTIKSKSPDNLKQKTRNFVTHWPIQWLTDTEIKNALLQIIYQFHFSFFNQN